MTPSKARVERRLLIVSYCYPPFPAMGSARIASFVRHLPAFGWKTAVVTIRPGRLAPFQLPQLEDESSEQICRTPVLDISRLFKALAGGRLEGNNVSRAHASRKGGLRRLALALYDRFLAFPDSAWPWYYLGRRRALAFAHDFGPDLLLSSSPPETAHVLGAYLGRRLGIPWVPDFRDPWSQTPWRDFSPRGLAAARALERKVIAGAAALCTVSEPIAEALSRLHAKSAFTVTNGFEPGPVPESPPQGPFRLLYTGMIYPGRREPGIIFEAVRLLRLEGRAAPRNLRLVFYGPNHQLTRRLAASHDVSDFVDTPGEISREEAQVEQRRAHALLQLEWNDPRTAGVFPGKFFEYLGAGRPILAVGPRDSVVENVLRETGAGNIAHDAPAAAELLARALALWKEGRSAAAPRNEENIARYTRRAQASKLAERLEGILQVREGRKE